MRFRSTSVLCTLVVLIATAPAGAQVFTKNQILLRHASPATIPPDYDKGKTFTGALPAGTPVHLVYGVQVTSSSTSADPLSLTIASPPSFAATSVRCVRFPGGAAPGTPFTAGCTLAALPALSPGPLAAPEDKVIVVVDGYYREAGAFTTSFEVSRGATKESSPVNAVVDALNLPADLAITKQVKPKDAGTFGAAATIPFGGIVTYTLTVSNLSAPAADRSTDVYLGSLLKVWDSFSAPPANDVRVDGPVQAIQCTSTGGADCPATPTPSMLSLDPASGKFLLLDGFGYPGGSHGFLPAGGSFRITFDMLVRTPAPCSPSQGNRLFNDAFFTLSSRTAVISDVNPANNSTRPKQEVDPPTTVVTLTGLPVCPTIPEIDVRKTLVPATFTPRWNVPFLYEITFTNTSGRTLTGVGLDDYIHANAPPITAKFAASDVICTPACIAPLPASNESFVGGSFSFMFSLKFGPLSPGAEQKVQYQMHYDAPCTASRLAPAITNRVLLTGAAKGKWDLVTPMPALPPCELATVKTITSQPPVFDSFPATFKYHVDFRNTSQQTIRVGTMIDALTYDSKAFALELPIVYSYTCEAKGLTLPAPLNSRATRSGVNVSIESKTPHLTGWRLIDFSHPDGVVFPPGSSIGCDVELTVNQPPANDSRCQGAGDAHLVNSAFMDPMHDFHGDTVAFPAEPVMTLLPKCASISVGKTVTGDVFAGGPATFLLTVKNAGNDPVSNVVLTDDVPADFTNVSWTCPSGCTVKGGTGNAINKVRLDPIAAGATVTVTVTATAPTRVGTYCNVVNATFDPAPALTFFEGDRQTLTRGSACVQVQPPLPPVKPVLSKKFEPGRVAANGVSILVLTITNSAGDPKQTGIAFSDTLPPGLRFGSVLSNGCGGTAAISSDSRTVTLTGGQLAGRSCQVNVRIRASGTCGVYPNTSQSFTNVQNLDVSGIDQKLEVGQCGGLTVKKVVDGAPPAFKGRFTFLVQCATPAGLNQRTVAVDWPAPGTVTLNDVPPGSECTVTEGQLPAVLPAGLNWSGLPVYAPPGAVRVPDNGAVVTVTNKLGSCDGSGQVTIAMIIEGLPKDYAGVFPGTLRCWSAGKLTTTPVTLTSPSGLSTTVGNIPPGSTCTFEETSQPLLPAGLQWTPPVYQPPFGTVTFDRPGCKQITVTNRARQCCALN